MKQVRFLLIVLLGLTLFACRSVKDIPPTAIEKEIDFENGWEGLSESSDGANIVRQISETVAESGASSAYHEINYGDHTYRSESQDKDKSSIRGEEWAGISIYLPEDYTADTSPEIILQWHATKDQFELPRSPNLALMTRDGHWEVVYRSDPHRFSLGGRTPLLGNDTYVVLDSHLDDRGKWVDWVFHIIWDHAGTGLLQVWKDGEVVVDEDPLAIGYNDQIGCWVQFGLYKWDWQRDATDVVTRAIYHDNYWRSSEKPSDLFFTD